MIKVFDLSRKLWVITPWMQKKVAWEASVGWFRAVFSTKVAENAIFRHVNEAHQWMLVGINRAKLLVLAYKSAFKMNVEGALVAAEDRPLASLLL
jgi:hypothetical protein